MDDLGTPGPSAINRQPADELDDMSFDYQRYEHNLKMCVYNVLMVEWDDRHIVASRLALGRVYTRLWREAAPQENVIVLG